MTWSVNCLVACHNANGVPVLWPVTVTGEKEQMDEGEHYEAAKKAADEQGYEGPFVVFDEFDTCSFGGINLFTMDIWGSNGFDKVKV